MNIVRPGDHVVLVIPQGHSSIDDHNHFQKMFAQIPDSLASAPVRFTMTSLAIGAVGSSPQVLFILRKDEVLSASDMRE